MSRKQGEAGPKVREGYRKTQTNKNNELPDLHNNDIF